MNFDFKNLHAGELISKKISEQNIQTARICNFFKLDSNKVEEMLLQKSMDTEILLKWCKLLEYDFFRMYSQHLILYSPPAKKDGTNITLPQFRKNIYSKEIISFILELLEKGEKSAAEIIHEYGIPKTTLYKWKQKYTGITHKED